jgi:hypothetical protein
MKEPARPNGGVLGLDIATTVGWCYIPPDGEAPPIWGSHRMADKKGTAPTGEVLDHWNGYLDALLDSFAPCYIIYESVYIPAPGSKGPPLDMHVLERLLGMAGIAHMQAYRYEIAIRSVSTSEWTRFLTGTARHGTRNKKKAACIEVCRRNGFGVADDNEADAVGVALYGEYVMTPYRRMMLPLGDLFAGAI